MLSLHVISVNLLGESYSLVLRYDNRLIKILLECSVKYVVNDNIRLYKSRIFLPLLSHQISFSFVADFLPPIQILRLPEDWSPHVHIGGWSNFFHIKDLFFSFLLFPLFLLLLLNFSSPAVAATTTHNDLASISRRRHISLLLFINGVASVV
jgi:hypothetical protein